MFVQYNITLTPARSIPSDQWLGIPLNGFVYEQVRRVKPELAQLLHDDDDKPFSLSFDKAGHSIELTLNTWDADLIAVIPSAFAVDKPGHIHDIDIRVDGIRRVQSLDVKAPVSLSQRKTVQIDFRTPTCFSSQGKTLLLPEARLILDSIARRTLSETGTDVEQFYRIVEGFTLEAYKLETVMVDFQRFTKPGFVGWCQFQIEKDLPPDDRKQLLALLRVMPYTGIGYKTTMGMGMVSLDI